MTRRIFSGLVGAALVWAVMAGECAACQQLLRSPASDGACCTSQGKCKTAPAPAPGHKHCKSPAELSVQAAVAEVGLLTHFDLPLAVASGEFGASPASEPPPAARGGPPSYSLPDLYCLNSAFRI